MLDYLIYIGLALLWSLVGLVLSSIFSLFITRVILGVRLRNLLVEIEDRQNAAVGVIFKNIAVVTSVILLPFVSDGFSPSEGFLIDILWMLGGGLVTVLIVTIIGYFILHALASRKHLQETAIGYLRRELIEEKNQALAHFIMAIFLIVTINVIGQAI